MFAMQMQRLNIQLPKTLHARHDGGHRAGTETDRQNLAGTPGDG